MQTGADRPCWPLFRGAQSRGRHAPAPPGLAQGGVRILALKKNFHWGLDISSSVRLCSSRGRGNHETAHGREDGRSSPPPPPLGVNPCLSSSYTNGDRFRPRPFQTDRRSDSASSLALSAGRPAVARSECTGRRPSLAGDPALILEWCSQRIERCGFPGCEAHALSEWFGALVWCGPTSAVSSAVARVLRIEATHIGSVPTGRWQAGSTGAESEFPSVSRRRRRAVPKTRPRGEWREFAPPVPGTHSRCEPRSCSGHLASSIRPSRSVGLNPRTARVSESLDLSLGSVLVVLKAPARQFRDPVPRFVPRSKCVAAVTAVHTRGCATRTCALVSDRFASRRGATVSSSEGYLFVCPKGSQILQRRSDHHEVDH